MMQLDKVGAHMCTCTHCTVADIRCMAAWGARTCSHSHTVTHTYTHAHTHQVLVPLVYGSIVSEEQEELTPHHFAHLVPLAQAGLDYMLFQANATGAALVSV